jgi:hypothetical protein
LTYVSARFGDAAWYPLAREVAEFARDSIFSTAATGMAVNAGVESKR